MKVIIAGGGTGGHIFPAVAIGHALQRLQPGTELLFVGAIGKMEMEKVPKEGFKIVGLDIAGFDRGNIFKNILLPFKLWKSRRQANDVLKSFRPDVVVGVGGYASFPVLYCAQGKGIATLIQEQNSFAGKSNKILGKRARAVCVAYEHMERFFPSGKITITGNPVRSRIAQSNITKEEGAKLFGLDVDRKTILIVGGSLGAKTINEAIEQGLGALMEEGVQLIWQTGKLFIEQARHAAAAYGRQIVACDFIQEMEYAYAAADIVVSRAGAMASAELCIVGKPVIFVPFPFAAEDHQTSNAMALVNKSAALMIKNDNAPADLVKTLKELLHNEPKQKEMSANILKEAIKDADIRIAKKVIEISR